MFKPTFRHDILAQLIAEHGPGSLELKQAAAELFPELNKRSAADDTAFLDAAEALAKRSRCQSKQVCAIAVKNGRIIATGLNGSVRGSQNCCERFPAGVTPENRAEHREWSARNELHAEMNLIAEAAKTGIRLDGATIYCTLQPCERCTMHLTQIGTTRIVYRHEYDFGDLEFSQNLLSNLGIAFEKEGEV